MKIAIQPVSIFTPQGTKSAVLWEIRYIGYTPDGGAQCDSHLWTAEPADAAVGPASVEVGSSVVVATPAQCAEWTDDTEFAKALAVNAGLTPL